MAESTTLTSSHLCDIVAVNDGKVIGEAGHVTFITEGNAAMGTVSFKECIADPRGCDLVIDHVSGDNRSEKIIFSHVDLSDNLYLEVPIVFVTDSFSRSERNVENI